MKFKSTPRIWLETTKQEEKSYLLSVVQYIIHEFCFFQVRDAPPIHHVVIQGDRIRAFGFSTNPAAANRASAATTNSTTDGASDEQNLQLPPSPTATNEDGGEILSQQVFSAFKLFLTFRKKNSCPKKFSFQRKLRAIIREKLKTFWSKH